MSAHPPAALPTLGWVDNGRFHPLQNVVLQSLMDCPVRSWEDCNGTDRKRLRNLKCMLPNGRLVPGQVPIVREFDRNWPQDWRATVWADGRKCIRVEHMVEEEDIVQAFDIDPTPAPTFIGDATYVISPDVTDVRYGGWTDNTYLFVVARGGAAGKFDINFSPLEELNGVIYDVHSTVTLSNEGFPECNPAVTTEDVGVFIWNCRGIARASFRPHLFTIREVTGADVVVLTETRAAGKNARSLLNTATTMEYFYTEPHGFVGGVSVMWDTSRVGVTGIIGDDYYVSFQVKGTI